MTKILVTSFGISEKFWQVDYRLGTEARRVVDNIYGKIIATVVVKQFP